MKMTNVIINHNKMNYWTVQADTERFGKAEILFEGITLNECLDYIWKYNGNTPYKIEAVDFFNENKVWIVKRTKCGHYYFNQKICGKIFYKKFVRGCKSHIMSLVECVQEMEIAYL